MWVHGRDTYQAKWSHRKMPDVYVAYMDSLRQVAISVPKIYKLLTSRTSGFDLIPFTKRDMYNEVRRQRGIRKGDVNAMIRYFEAGVTKLECMEGKAPRVVITGGDRSMRLAINEVFPEAHHRLCVWITVVERQPREDGTIIVTQKYRPPNNEWNVMHVLALDKYACGCLRMESLPTLCAYTLNFGSDESRNIFASLQASGSACCVSDALYKLYLEQIIQEATNLEKMNELGNSGSIGGGIEGGRVLDPVGIHTKGTRRGNAQVGTREVKRRKCGMCGVVGHR
ncbi:hypothetical protein AHAS_Ahas12G0152400 [Arachis hypogaea]